MLIRTFLLMLAAASAVAKPGATQDSADDLRGSVVMEMSITTARGEIAVGGRGPHPWAMLREVSGKILWEKTFTQYEPGRFTRVQTKANGGFLVIGAANWQTGPALAIRLDANGNVLWERTFGDNSYSASAMEYVRDGGTVIVGGASSGDGSARWAARLSEQGDLLWQKNFDGPDNWGRAAEVSSLPDGGFVIAGERWTSCMCEGNRSGEPWAARLNANGDTLWEKTYPGLAFNEVKEQFVDFRVSSLWAHSDANYTLKGRAQKFLKADKTQELGSWELELDGAGAIVGKKFVKETDQPPK